MSCTDFEEESDAQKMSMPRLKILNVILALAAFPLLGLLARDYLVLRYPPEARHVERAGPVAARASRAFEDYAAIVEKGVYPGATRKLAKIDLLEAAGAEATRSEFAGVKLLGTYTGKGGYAVFEKEGGGAQEVFKVGQTVFGAGVLSSVASDKAVVTVGGSDVTFTIFVENIPDALSNMGKENPVAGPGGGAYSRQVSEGAWVLDQKAVENAVSDMSKVLTDARLTPKVTSGAVEGFLVTEIKPRGIFDAIGLQDGDVLTRINGYQIDSPEKAVQVLSALKGQDAIDLDIIRKGQPKSFHYSVR